MEYFILCTELSTELNMVCLPIKQFRKRSLLILRLFPHLKELTVNRPSSLSIHVEYE